MYRSLHVHYERGSIGDSILKTGKAVKKAKELGMDSLAITDHGSMANVVNFYKECNEQGIKPLIGCEVYEVEDRLDKSSRKMNHLVLLAKNKQGYKDLLHISNDAQLRGYYYKGRTDMDIFKEYGKDIIALSACLGGRIPQLILDIVKVAQNGLPEDYEGDDNEESYIENTYNKLINLIAEYKECFADFYLELQPGNFDEQITVNKLLVDLANDTNTELVITNDVHYLNEEDWLYHDQHVKMARKQKHDDPMIYPAKDYYLMGYDEIREMFPYLDQDVVEKALANTKKISDEIDLSNLYDGKIKMPKADIPEGFSEDEYLAKISYERLEEIKYDLKDPSEYFDRVEYELDTLREVGFSGYLLIIKDIYDYSEREHIPLGPGRGSIGGSLVAYLAGITQVDPIKYGLLFERFISKHRKGSVPD